MKKIVLIVVALGIAVATVPLWGSCNLKYQFCTTVCTIQHFNSDAKKAGCKTRCAAEKAGCIAGEGAESAGDFLEQLGK